MNQRRASRPSDLPAPLCRSRSEIDAAAGRWRSARARVWRAFAAGGVVAAFALGASLQVACGGSDASSGSQVPPAQTAAAETCARLQTCGDIGHDKLYDDVDQCESQERARWDTLWPPSECDGPINQPQFDVCIHAVENVECNSESDLINVLVNKCPRTKICALPGDASAD
jgi:hypothetical protein